MTTHPAGKILRAKRLRSTGQRSRLAKDRQGEDVPASSQGSGMVCGSMSRADSCRSGQYEHTQRGCGVYVSYANPNEAFNAARFA